MSGLQIIGAGFGRTGTLSTKYALEQLGFDKCYHMHEVFEKQHQPHWSAIHRGEAPDWDGLFAGYQAAVDWPSCNFWEAQLAHYPDAKVLLTRRDPDKWYTSVMNTIYKIGAQGRRSDDPGARAAAAWAWEIVWDFVFDDRMEDRDYVIGVYEAHNQHVIDTVPAGQLLDFDVAQGWQPLCEFLGVPVPEADFPRVNSTEDFFRIFSR